MISLIHGIKKKIQMNLYLKQKKTHRSREGRDILGGQD